MSEQPWLSIVTVVRDDAPGFARTLESLRAQELAEVHFVVVDSSGEKQEIPDALSRADVTADIVWTEPRGIYPAMNTGLQRATGDWVYFLNAGDTLHDDEVLDRLRGRAAQTDRGWMFGPVELTAPGRQPIVTPPWDYPTERRANFARGLFPPHQGTLVRTALLRFVGGFDTSYAIAADYAAFLRLSLTGDPEVLDFVIASFAEGGASTLRWQESFREFHRARRSILQPTGAAALRERADTAWHFARVFAYREVVAPLRRSARR